MNRIDLIEECKGAATIGISGHIRPDGDCIGSCMALWMYLKKVCADAQISIFLEKPADIFACIDGIDQIDSVFPDREPFDVFFALDTVKDRLGGAEKYFDAAVKTINIDHHISNAQGCAHVNYVEPQISSTSELVYHLMDKKYVDEAIAKAVYIGIIHDCGVFHYSNTSPQTLRTAAELIEYGFDFPQIIDQTFYEKSYVQNQIMGRALMESELLMEGICVVGHVDRKMMGFYGAGPKDMDGIINQLRIIRGVECAIFAYETGDEEYKVSLRSNRYVDVSKVASLFGGGGHVRAAGCTMKGTFRTIVERLLGEIKKQMVIADGESAEK